MARLPRLAIPGLAHLVVLRGHSGLRLFADDEDRSAFLAALRESLALHRVALEAYVLAADHVHLLLRPVDGPGLSAALQGLGRRYVTAFNRRHGRSGSLWAGRFRAAPLQPGATVLNAMRFIDSHALRAGQVESAPDERWCSVAHHLGLRRDPMLSDGPDWWALGNTPFDREAAYRQALDEGLSHSLVRALADASHKGWPAGDAAWLTTLQSHVSRPLTPRSRGRPVGTRQR